MIAIAVLKQIGRVVLAAVIFGCLLPQLEAGPPPRPFSLQGLSSQFWRLLPRQAKLTRVATGFGFTEGPVWDHHNFLYVSDEVQNKIYRVYPDGRRETAIALGDPDGNTYDLQFRLLDCASVLRAIIRITPGGKYVVLAALYQGKRFNSPNDVVVGPDKAIYFTDPTLDLPKGAKQEIPFQGVYRLGADGSVRLETKDLTQPNGLAFSPDGKRLYVDDSEQRNIRVYRFNSDGTLSDGRVFADENDGSEDGVPDGMKVDVKGNLFVVGPKGIWVWDPNGRHLGAIVIPEQPANLAWGDEDYKTLYITATTSVYRIRASTQGFVPYLAYARHETEQDTLRDSQSARADALRGLALARQNDLHGAMQSLRNACELEPNDPDYAYDYAVLLIKDEQFQSAVPILERLHGQAPQADDILVNLFRAYSGAKEFQKLSTVVENLPTADYANQSLLKTLATILARGGQTSAAAALWQTAIRYEPDQALPYAALAEIRIGQGQASQAAALLNSAAPAARGPLYLYADGETEMALRNYPKAVSIFRELTRILPQNQNAWRQLVQCDLLAGRLNEAEQAAGEAVREFPEVTQFQYQEAVIDYMLGRTATAIQTLSPWIDDVKEGDARPVLLMAVLKSQSGDYPEAARYFSRAQKMDPGCNALASYFYGANLLRMRRLSEAQAELGAAIRCHPHFALAEYRLGQALSQDGKLTEALTALENATRDAPKLAEPYYAQAQIDRRLGNQAGARQALARFNSLQEHVAGSDRKLLSVGFGSRQQAMVARARFLCRGHTG